MAQFTTVYPSTRIIIVLPFIPIWWSSTHLAFLFSHSTWTNDLFFCPTFFKRAYLYGFHTYATKIVQLTPLAGDRGFRRGLEVRPGLGWGNDGRSFGGWLFLNGASKWLAYEDIWRFNIQYSFLVSTYFTKGRICYVIFVLLKNSSGFTKSDLRSNTTSMLLRWMHQQERSSGSLSPCIDVREHPAETMSGWWFGTWIFVFPYIGNFIIPTDELIGWNHQPDVCDPIILPWFPSKVFLHINPVMTLPIIWWMREGNSLCEAPMFGGHFTIPNCSMMLHVWFFSMCLHIYSDMTGSYVTSMYASWISMYATCS